MEGDAYFESVNCSANVAHLTFHGPIIRAIYGKLGFVCLAGPPNIAKTKEIRSALHFSSSGQYFFAMKVKFYSVLTIRGIHSKGINHMKSLTLCKSTTQSYENSGFSSGWTV